MANPIDTGRKYGLKFLLSLINNKPKTANWKTYLGEKYDDFFDSFGNIYKDLTKKEDLEGLSEFKKEVGKKTFDTLVTKTKKEKKLTRKDTKKAESMGQHKKAVEVRLAQSWFVQNKGAEKVEATKIIVDDMINNASTTKKYNFATQKMEEVFDFGQGTPFTYEKMLPKLKEKFPNIFKNMNLNAKDKRNWQR